MKLECNPPIPFPFPPIRHCDNCAYQSNGSLTKSGACLRSGLYCVTARRFPSEACDLDFSGWAPRPIPPPRPGLITRILNEFRNACEPD